MPLPVKCLLIFLVVHQLCDICERFTSETCEQLQPVMYSGIMRPNWRIFGCFYRSQAPLCSCVPYTPSLTNSFCLLFRIEAPQLPSSLPHYIFVCFKSLNIYFTLQEIKIVSYFFIFHQLFSSSL